MAGSVQVIQLNTRKTLIIFHANLCRCIAVSKTRNHCVQLAQPAVIAAEQITASKTTLRLPNTSTAFSVAVWSKVESGGNDNKDKY